MTQMVSAISTRVYGGASYVASNIIATVQRIWSCVKKVFAFLSFRKAPEGAPPAPPVSGRSSQEEDTVIVTARGDRKDPLPTDQVGKAASAGWWRFW